MLKLLITIALLVGMVSAGAYLVVKSQPAKQIAPPISQIPVQTTPTPIPDETATWKTYTNNAYKFSLQYPPNFSVEEQFNNNSRLISVIISNPNPRPGGGYSQPHIEVVVFENDATDLNDWLNKHTTILPFDDPSVSKVNSQFFYRGVKNQKQALLGGKSALTFESTLFESSPNPTLTVFNNYIIGLVLDNESENKDPDLKGIYPQILSTFKFINTEGDQNISDAKLQEMINNCEIIGDYIYHSGEKGVVLKNNETLELKNKSAEEIKKLISEIPRKCGPERVKVIE